MSLKWLPILSALEDWSKRGMQLWPRQMKWLYQMKAVK
jgi:hypothetical protein